MADRDDKKTGVRRANGLAGSGLDLHIDELVLHGFRPGDRYAIAASLERELSRLFLDEGVPPDLGGDRFRKDAGAFDVPHGATPDAVGIQVARAIHRSLGGSAEGRGPEGKR
jgi:hypothetical protein